jgi:hypothetical protein
MEYVIEQLIKAHRFVVFVGHGESPLNHLKVGIPSCFVCSDIGS